MKQFVSDRSIWAVASVVTMTALWVIFVLPVTGVVPGGLLGLMTLAAAVVVGMRSTRSMAQVIQDVDTEPLPIPATAVHKANPASKSVH